MITAIIGKAGTGKSTIAKMIAPLYDKYIEADEIVKQVYMKNDTILLFLNHKSLRKSVVNRTIDKNELIKILLSDEKARKELEDYVFYSAILPIVYLAKLDNISLLVDGILPRFSYYFDQVINIKIIDDIRKQNLKKRGVSEERIEELFELQKDM